MIGNDSLNLENGKQKIVVLGKKLDSGAVLPQHYMLQLPDGKWVSKLGIEGPLIRHEKPQNLTGGIYGNFIGVYSRPNNSYQSKVTVHG